MTMAITSTASTGTIKVNGTDAIRFSTDKGLEVFNEGNWIDVQTDVTYKELVNLVGQSTFNANATALAFDTSGNLYWAVCNLYNGTTYSLTSYVYKITPNGELTTFASQATTGGFGTALAFDTSGNLYWAIGNHYNGTTYSLTSYVYKITPNGELTTFASQATTGITGTDLAFDTSGNLYWAICNFFNGTTYSQTSYVYKITPAGTKTTFASQATTGGRETALAFDTSGNLYWAVCEFFDGTTYSGVSSVYKITPAGTKTTFDSRSTTGGAGTDLIFDASGNLYWAVSNYRNGSNFIQRSYVYKITPGGTRTTFASSLMVGALRTALTFDTLGNLYWGVSNYGTSTALVASNFIYKITPTGTKTTFASETGFGSNGTAFALDTNDNLYWAISNYGDSVTQTRNSYVYVKSL